MSALQVLEVGWACMGARNGKRATPERSGQAPQAVDTWVKLGNEIVRSVLPNRGRTVNLIMLLTVPASVITGIVVTAVLVVIPHPSLAVGALASSVGVYGMARIMLHRLTRRSRASLTPDCSAEGPEDPAALPPP